jgi:hypothetical protein
LQAASGATIVLLVTLLFFAGMGVAALQRRRAIGVRP